MPNLAIAKRPEYHAARSSYAQVAAEYYDAARHPTCANFREASALYIRSVLQSVASDGTIVEAGAGRSLAAEILIEQYKSIDKLVMLDSSIEMLRHSIRFLQYGASAIVCDACALPFARNSVSLIISSLGDPYNLQAFWDEAARCLRSGGRCVFTTPSYEWATSFRNSSRYERQGYALFDLQENRSIYLLSLVHSVRDQMAMIDRAGLTVIEVTTIDAERVPPPHSAKLLSGGGVVTGYTITK